MSQTDSAELKEVLKTVNAELPQILDTVNDKVPTLLNKLSDVMYGAENAQKFATAVSGFYKTLLDSGMKPEEAFILTQQYMGSLNLGKGFAHASGEGRGIRFKKVFKNGKDIDVEMEDC